MLFLVKNFFILLFGIFLIWFLVLGLIVKVKIILFIENDKIIKKNKDSKEFLIWKIFICL